MKKHPGMKKNRIKKKHYPVYCPVCGKRLFDSDGEVPVTPQVATDLEDTGNHNFMKCPQCKNEISF